jgi:hypothetical protein
MTGTQFTEARDLDFGIEELDELVDPEFDVGHFAAGFATGLAIIGLAVAVAT